MRQLKNRPRQTERKLLFPNLETLLIFVAFNNQFDE